MKKKSKKVCQSYGLTQSEMATMLGITRAQWSMYESNERDLPVLAMKAFREMEAHVASSKLAKQVQDKKAPEIIRKGAEKMLLDNLVEQQTLVRKIEAESTRDIVAEKQRRIADFISVSGKDSEKGTDLVRQLLEDKAKEALDPKRLFVRMKLEIRLEVLKLEERLIREKMEGE